MCCTTILPCYYTVPYTKEHLVLVCCTTILLPCYYTTFLNRGKCTKLYSIVVKGTGMRNMVTGRKRHHILERAGSVSGELAPSTQVPVGKRNLAVRSPHARTSRRRKRHRAPSSFPWPGPAGLQRCFSSLPCNSCTERPFCLFEYFVLPKALKPY